MKFLATVIMLAATVLGRPVADTLQTFTSPDGLRIRNVGYQGDGFYLATFDENNVATVDFTPLTELNSTILASYNSQVAASNNKLNERSELVARGSTCGDDGIVSDLDHANVQLAQNGNGKWYNKDAWGWVHFGSATSYFCNYQAQTLAYDLLIQFQVWVSNDCGGSQKLGYHRCTNACGINDLSVGRTYNGDNFCAEGFFG